MTDPSFISYADAKRTGLKRYFTGRPCKAGHVATWFVSMRRCSVCQAETRKAYYCQNREAEIAKVKAYYLANHAEVRRKRNAYAAANSEQISERFKEYYQLNKDRLNKKKAAERAENPAAFAARYKKWADENPEKVLANVRTRIARKKGAEGSHTGREINGLFDQQRGRCAYCQAKLACGYHADHIVPLARGGSNWITNIQLLCAPCNQRKAAKDPIDYARQIGKLL